MSASATLTPVAHEEYDEFDSRERYEIIDGERVELPPMSTKATALTVRLTRFLSVFGIEHNIGEAYNEMLVKLPLPIDRNRRPDVVFVPYRLWPKDADFSNDSAWDVLPDLCVEVMSPSDRVDELMDKIEEYFSAGVRLVWVIYPRHGLVHIYESLSKIRGLTRTDTLDGGDVLPGFRLPLTELFPLPNNRTRSRPDEA